MKSLNKEILRLAVPSILANITVPLVGMVDIAVAGHLKAGELLTAASFIGGISIGSMLFDLLYWNFAFLRVCTGGLTAQAFGRGDMRESARILVRALLLALGCAILILAVQWPFTKLAFLVVDCSDEVRSLALDYFFIRVWAAPATLGLMAFRGWFIGMQDSVSSMVTDLVVNFVNIGASIVLALGTVPFGGQWGGLGFKGVAMGTVIAQYSGLLYCAVKLLAKYSGVFDGFGREDVAMSFRPEVLKSFTSMNRDYFVRSLCFTGIYIGYTVISARFGDLMLASSAIMMKLLMIFSYFTDGFAYAGEALTGRFIGEGSLERTRQAIRRVFVWSLSLVLGFMVIYWVAGVPMLRLMTSDEAVVQACRQFIPWLVLMPPFGCVAFTWDGIYLGATASRGIRNSMLWALLVFFVCWFAGIAILRACTDPSVLSSAAGEGSTGFLSLVGGVAKYQIMAIHVLMVAYFSHLIARSVVLSVQYRREVLAPHFNQV